MKVFVVCLTVFTVVAAAPARVNYKIYCEKPYHFDEAVCVTYRG